ncbi:hypothetical protein GXM_04462 [Nostoc sphaeroides CCNUC1]|uniref:Uncharacterized protein n=1 Tax=Nostoc sphaeroides CCNUC1 TaxID=2653204 RepID=A0A5P8W324_9NOSO|nr:hypothetical protein GXM_04462 [Nostoc sphaeroides CCNUC1]
MFWEGNHSLNSTDVIANGCSGISPDPLDSELTRGDRQVSPQINKQPF